MLRANLRMLLAAASLDEQAMLAINEAFAAAPTQPRQALDESTRARLLADLVPAYLAPRAPIVLCGFDPDTLAALGHAFRIAERSGPFRQRVLIVEPDAATLALSLSRVDLSQHGLAAERLVLFVGSNWHSALHAWLHDRLDLAIPGAVADAGFGNHLVTAVQELLRALRSEQGETLANLKRSTETGDAPGARDVLTARTTLRDAAERNRPLSVLLCGSRYTTYVRHALEGLAEGLRALGHRTEILLEPDDSSVLTQLAYRRRIEACQPDLIITANYPRALLNGALPDAIPHVCWIQDSMPHLLDERIGHSVAETELFIGNTLPELCETFGYPTHTMVPACVPASEHRFHPGTIDQASRDRWACDVAFVSHHSETPEALRDRLIREMRGDSHGRTIVMAFWDAMPRLLAEAARSPLGPSIDHAIREHIARALSQELTPAQHSMIKHRVALPLFGRAFRYEALRWAKTICDRRSWSFRVYGHGWDRTPGFTTHAAGAIEHGESLRACYQATRVHLHLDPNTLTHQRVFECAMSGGLPIARFHHDALNPLLIAATSEAHEANANAWTELSLGKRYLTACDELCIEPMPCAQALSTQPRQPPSMRKTMLQVFDSHWLYAGLADVTFRDEPSLERALERAITDPDWRTERSTAMRTRMIGSVGMRAFAERMLASAWPIIGWKSMCIQQGLGWPPRADWAEFLERKGGQHAA